MIALFTDSKHLKIAEEFFQLFKTPWEVFNEKGEYSVVITSCAQRISTSARLIIVFGDEITEWDRELNLIADQTLNSCNIEVGDQSIPIYGAVTTFSSPHAGLLSVEGNGQYAGISVDSGDLRVIRIGYDLFYEVNYLLTAGQPAGNSAIPTLDLHIALLRQMILLSGIPLIEIPPLPAGYPFMVCLTHDIDFIGIRQHLWDHTFFGFLYRATVGTVKNLLKKKISISDAGKNFSAVISLPLVFLRILKDFWFAFEKYLKLEKGLHATYFFCPFKNRVGEKIDSPKAYRRAMRYDVHDIHKLIGDIIDQGHEVGVHGIDAWHDAEKGKEELERILGITGEKSAGIRMHWLCFGPQTPGCLQQAGYSYDSTCGYNDAVGFKAGTSQVFMPPGTSQLMELPLHVQDTALFYPGRMALACNEGMKRFSEILDLIKKNGGVFTLLWHDRSLVPERLWEKAYVIFLGLLKENSPWFATASQITGWFRKRRNVHFSDMVVKDGAVKVNLNMIKNTSFPGMRLRLYIPRCRTGLENILTLNNSGGFEELEISESATYSFQSGVDNFKVSV